MLGSGEMLVFISDIFITSNGKKLAAEIKDYAARSDYMQNDIIWCIMDGYRYIHIYCHINKEKKLLPNIINKNLKKKLSHN